MALKNILDWLVTKTLTIVPKVSLTSTGMIDGSLEIYDGILYMYDATRTKWLSVNRQTLVFSKAGITADQYLNLAGGVIDSGSGYRIPANSTIVSMSVQSSTTDNYSVSIRKSGSVTDLATLSVPGTDGTSTVSTNTNLTINEDIQCYLNYTGSSAGVEDPVVMIQLAWRG